MARKAVGGAELIEQLNDMIAELIKAEPRENGVALDKRIPVHITYFTAEVDDDGELVTQKDISATRTASRSLWRASGTRSTRATTTSRRSSLPSSSRTPPDPADPMVAVAATAGAPDGSRRLESVVA